MASAFTIDLCGDCREKTICVHVSNIFFKEVSFVLKSIRLFLYFRICTSKLIMCFYFREMSVSFQKGVSAFVGYF